LTLGHDFPAALANACRGELPSGSTAAPLRAIVLWRRRVGKHAAPPIAWSRRQVGLIAEKLPVSVT
jgi:hypothetical protein